MKTRGPAIAAAVALLITLYGGLLRLDALVGKYGSLDHPAWARIVTQDIAPYAARLRPSSIDWRRVPEPYVGGDPINYLKYAREMRSFYQAHVREPVFLALTRGWLWALDGQDAAVSFASFTGSTLAVLATCLLGAALGSRPAGLLAALLMAIEYEAITWAPDGWRDDAFTATVLFATWALIRLWRQPSAGNAVLAGALCGVACLTRITALSFVVPALLWLAAMGPPVSRKARVTGAGIAIGVLALVVMPYLVSCAMATGDPFFAINYHTTYYRHAEGRPIDESMSVAEYLGSRLVERPVATFDTALNGVFVEPFITKWRGFEPWIDGLGGSIRWVALAGLGVMPFFGAGRLFLVVLLTSLVPYMLTWNVGGGNEWRFTMHVYPFYLAAAAFALAGIAGTAWRTVMHGARLQAATARAAALRAGAVAGVTLAGIAAYYVLPWFVTREAIANSESTSVETGPRDLLFYRDGWTEPRRDGITARVSRGERSVVRVPLPDRRDYDIVLRIDPVDPAVQRRVGVLFNGELVAMPLLTWDPERVGTYRIHVRAPMVRGTSEVTIIPDTLVSAGSAGPRFAWLDPDDRIGVRLWYVRVLPLP